MDDTPKSGKSFAESLATLKAIRQQWQQATKPVRALSESLKPLHDIGLKLSLHSDPVGIRRIQIPPSYKHTDYKADGAILPTDCLLPQQSKPPPEKRPSTLDKDADRREIYAQVVKDMGRYCQRGVLVAEAASRAGCSVDSIKRALGLKK